MSRIRGRGNKETEIVLAVLLRRNGITGWRRHLPLLGRPDVAFPKYKIAVFVDGCFWHGCPKHSNMPINNRAFWVRKLSGNKSRDTLVTRTLRKNGWQVLRIWEHDLTKRPAACIRKIQSTLTKRRFPAS
jgi:DNA mismatch endonuclease (patch repair protein)